MDGERPRSWNFVRRTPEEIAAGRSDLGDSADSVMCVRMAALAWARPAEAARPTECRQLMSAGADPSAETTATTKNSGRTKL